MVEAVPVLKHVKIGRSEVGPCLWLIAMLAIGHRIRSGQLVQFLDCLAQLDLSSSGSKGCAQADRPGKFSCSVFPNSVILLSKPFIMSWDDNKSKHVGDSGKHPIQHWGALHPNIMYYKCLTSSNQGNNGQKIDGSPLLDLWFVFLRTKWPTHWISKK